MRRVLAVLRFLLSALPSAFLNACGETSTEPWVVPDLRVLSIVAEPPAVVPGSSVIVSVYLADPGNSGQRPLTVTAGHCPSNDVRPLTPTTAPGAASDCVAPDAIVLSQGQAQHYGYLADVYQWSFVYTVPDDILAGYAASALAYGFNDAVMVHADDGQQTIDGLKRVVVMPAGTTTLNQNPLILGAGVWTHPDEELIGEYFPAAYWVSGPVRGNVVPTLVKNQTYELGLFYDQSSAEKNYTIVSEGPNATTYNLTTYPTITWSCSPTCNLPAPDPYILYSPTQDQAANELYVVMRDGLGGEAFMALDMKVVDRNVGAIFP